MACGDVKFIRMEGFPQGILAIKKGAAVLKGHGFDNGTIEFDARFDPQDMDLPTIRFHRRDADNAEEFYLRPDSDCPAANDCVQYTPVFKGRMTWTCTWSTEVAAPISLTTWNHVRLVIDKRRMNVFINGQDKPALSVARLQGEADEGGIEFKGLRKLRQPDAVGQHGRQADDCRRRASRDPRLCDDGSSPRALATAHDFPRKPDTIPRAAGSFVPMTADESGLVNLNRRFAGPAHRARRPALSCGRRVRRTSTSRSDGFARPRSSQRRQVFKDDNFYYPATARRDPDGRLSLENGGFDSGTASRR